MERLADQVVELHRALETAGIEHAFGGALALAYYVANPRGTADIDVNLFLRPERCLETFEALPPGVTWTADDVAVVERDGQARLSWGRTPLDVFFNTEAFHEQAAGNAREVAFGTERIPVLAADDLVVFKAFFDRTRDWGDIEAMAEVRSFDPDNVLAWLARLLGPDDHRARRLLEVVRAAEEQGGAPPPRFTTGERGRPDP